MASLALTATRRLARTALTAPAERTWSAMTPRVLGAVATPRLSTTLWSGTTATPAARTMSTDMFCYQCEQTEKGTGCTTVGVCGKTAETAQLQDLLIYTLKGLAMASKAARAAGAPESEAANQFFLKALFSTLTNVNFDSDRFVDFIKEAVEHRAERVAAFTKSGGDAATLDHACVKDTPSDWTVEVLEAEGRKVGPAVDKEAFGDDVAGLKELVTYGLKGAAAYAAHAMELGAEQDAIHKGLQEVLAALTTETDAQELVGLAMKAGELAVGVVAMLDAAHTGRFGHPEPTAVNHAPTAGKAILISGHDMRDLEALLKQTEGTGVNVYTHGEMLPGHGYPGLKKYKHLVGNYGTAWQMQRFEFAKFPGPIIMTTNCISEPRPSYNDRIYTAGVTGWPGVKHIEGRDFSEVIKQAQGMEGFPETKAPKEALTGFGHQATLGVADQVIKAATEGHLKRLVLIGGCDGSEGERSYYTKLGMALPDESMILTLGCGKYRLLHKKDWGTVPGTGLPRLVDMGQCNDAYSAVVVATELAKALDTDINSLPLDIVLSWFEQKAVAVLLGLLHLGVQGIHIGPNLPAFITPAVLQQLIDTFGLVHVNDPTKAAGDAAKMVAGSA